MTNDGHGRFGDSEEHTRTGSQGSGNSNAAENLSTEDRSKGGKAAHEQGTAHEFTNEESSEAGKVGGSQ